MDIPIITERLSIQRLVPGDAEMMFRYRSDPKINRYQNWEPGSVEELRNFIIGLAEIGVDMPGRWYQLGLFLRDSLEMIGDCGIQVQVHDPKQVEIGITLSSEYHSRGFATEALKSIFGFLFMNLGKHRVYGSVDPRTLHLWPC